MALLIDADDTLWENIRVFHDVNDRFADWIAPEAPTAFLEFADQVQRELVVRHGYGAATFRLSLLETIRRHQRAEPTREQHERVNLLVEPFEWQSVDLLPGVVPTLEALRDRHDLHLVTKGDPTEQSKKLEVSGLESHFDSIHIVPEKTPDAYSGVVADQGLDVAESWMIGNSPRSDIVPALSVGLGAVHIPHPDTWGHEDGEVPDHDRLLVLDCFVDLLNHF